MLVPLIKRIGLSKCKPGTMPGEARVEVVTKHCVVELDIYKMIGVKLFDRRSIIE